MMLRILVIGLFCVTSVSMQNSIIRHTTASDTLTSGRYPNTGAADNAWEITVDQNHQILLQFLDFSLNETTSCTVDVLELYDGDRFSNVLIDRFCWDDATLLASTAYVASGSRLYLRLITAEGYSRKGFRAQYTSVDLEHTNSSGEVTSPGYPQTGHPVDEAWRIKVNDSYQIRLEFVDFALHEAHPCNDDYFELFDGQFNPYLLVGRWCFDSLNDLQEAVFISSGKAFYLRLRTRNGHSRRGFNASYNSILQVATPTDRQQVETTSILKSAPFHPQNLSIDVVGKSTITNTQRTMKTLILTGTTAGKSRVRPGLVVGILAAVVFIFSVIAIFIWKFKVTKAETSSSRSHEIQLQIAQNTGSYEDVNPHKDVIHRDSFQTTHKRKFDVNVSANVASSYVDPYCVYSEEIIQQTSERKANTPDGTYETPDVNLYSYADPNELQ